MQNYDYSSPAQQPCGCNSGSTDQDSATTATPSRSIIRRPLSRICSERKRTRTRSSRRSAAFPLSRSRRSAAASCMPGCSFWRVSCRAQRCSRSIFSTGKGAAEVRRPKTASPKSKRNPTCGKTPEWDFMRKLCDTRGRYSRLRRASVLLFSSGPRSRLRADSPAGASRPHARRLRCRDAAAAIFPRPDVFLCLFLTDTDRNDLCHSCFPPVSIRRCGSCRAGCRLCGRP